MKKKLVLLFTLMLISISSICLADAETTKQAYAERKNDVVVTAEGVNFRVAPSINSLIITELNKGEILAQLDTDGDWLCVIRPNGYVGWVHSNYVKIK